MFRLAALSASLAAFATIATAQPISLVEAFNGLPAQERATIQRELQEAGYYSSTIDGAWGPATFSSLIIAWDSLQYTGGAAPHWDTPDGARAFLAMVASGQVAEHLDAWGASDAIAMD